MHTRSALVLTPERTFVLSSTPDPTLNEGLRKRLVDAFSTDDGQGVLHLGAVELGAELPPSLDFARALGKQFMTMLCRLPDLEHDETTLPPTFDNIDALIDAAPPMTGVEYLDADVLTRLWQSMGAVFKQRLADFGGSVPAFLSSLNPAWQRVGRVCLHLAENPRNPERPFAFMATYTSELSNKGRVRHLPLAKALTQYAGAGNRDQLTALLKPLQHAARDSPLIAELMQSRAVFSPRAWTPERAYQFLLDVPTLEQHGLVTRIPDWWRKRQSRPMVQATIERQQGAVGLSAMLNFSVALAINGEALNDEELRALMQSSDNLLFLKGRWVEVDRTALQQVLEHWQRVAASFDEGQLTFIEGMRLLAGTPGSPDEDTPDDDALLTWSEVVAGRQLADEIAALHDPERLKSLQPDEGFQGTLRHYQATGVRWLWLLDQLGLGGCLADDMGLGKTIQVLALLALIKQQDPEAQHLLVAPTSLINNWRDELLRFTPQLKVRIVHRAEMSSDELASLEDERHFIGCDLVITTYGMLRRYPALGERTWRVAVLDEAQAIKNPGAKQTRAAHDIQARTRIALTGTPVENRLDDLWSIFTFCCPGLLGTRTAFDTFVRRLPQRRNSKHTNYAPLRRLIRPYILRRLKSDKRIIQDLPDKIDIPTYCLLAPAQAALYERTVEDLKIKLDEATGMERRGIVLAFLLRFKQICNHPSQWLDDGDYIPAHSGKFIRLHKLCEELAERQEKVLVFTQFRQLITPLESLLEKTFGQRGLVLHGGTSIKTRREHVKRFQQPGGPPFFVLSLKAGGTGLNLTAASHVIHFDRWWNPAVEDQATDRAFRIGQRNNVMVHKFICRGTIEEKIDQLIASKRQLSETLLQGSADATLTELSNDELIAMVSLDVHRALVED